MKIAIDSSPLESGHKIRGVGNYTRNLITELQILSKKKKNLIVKAINLEQNNVRSFDLIHYPYFDLFFISLPIFKPAKTVVTIHDVIPLLFPDSYPRGIKGSIKFQIQKLLLKHVDAVITDSATSKKDIVKFLEYPEEKIFPIYLGYEKHFERIKNNTLLQRVRQKYELPQKFVLYVGDVNFNKNLIRLADACKKAKLSLVIVGKQAAITNFDRTHPENGSWVEFLNIYGNDENVKRIGFVENDELVALYNLATVYCQPSLYEGFGLPVIEAMACGTPVVVSNTPALLEIGGNAVLSVNPHNSSNIAKGLQKLAMDTKLRKKLVEEGYKNIKRFIWKRTAEETYDVYEYVLGRI